MKLRVTAAALAILGIATSAIAKEPKQCRCTPAEKVAADPNPVREPDLRGTKTAPVHVDVMALPAATDEDKSERAEDRHQNRMLVVFTGVLALGTILLGIATLLLWRATRRLVLDGMENAERQLRAYVSVESSSISYDQGRPPQAGVTFKNYGNTPAYEFMISSGIGMAHRSMNRTTATEPIASLADARPGRNGGARQRWTDAAPVYPSNSSLREVDDLRHGEVRYRDVSRSRTS